MWKENDQKKQATEKDTWVQLKLQPALSRNAYLLRTNNKEHELLEAVP